MGKIDGLAYEEAGQGPAVVFVHAGIADRRMWDHQMAALAATHRVIRYDWRGRGESEDPAGPVCHHRDLLRLMDGLGVARAALVGCSMGGSYALEAALAAPDRVAALVLICSGLSGHRWPEEMIAQARERVHASIPAERLAAYRTGGAAVVDPADVEAFARAHARWQVAGPGRGEADLEAAVWELAVDMLRGVFAREWSRPPVPEQALPAAGRLGEITAPTLVINGLEDVPGIQEVSGLLAAGIPGAVLIDLPDTGHLPPVERPGQVTALLRDWLARHWR
ncbi:alpha/beta fold hydrolase [Thermoactinospora rubra]|uniref:alpha/beta fold hydrolase n=1 Tax=Thermoactinospora rubra TaxID=1088767 RepID=UPI001F0B412E|nr:alpha/beta fold hydrolase [Thermoactinospora rubra]